MWVYAGSNPVCATMKDLIKLFEEGIITESELFAKLHESNEQLDEDWQKKLDAWRAEHRCSPGKKLVSFCIRA